MFSCTAFSVMRIVQALHWLIDTLSDDGNRIRARLGAILMNPMHGQAIAQDLSQGFAHLPAWMQKFLRTVEGLNPSPAENALPGSNATSDKTPSRMRPDVTEGGQR